MIENNQVSEASIQTAFTQGYITSNEADAMREVYLNKAKVSLFPKASARFMSESNSSRKIHTS